MGLNIIDAFLIVLAGIAELLGQAGLHHDEVGVAAIAGGEQQQA